MTECKLITAVEKRRKWSIEEKRQIIEETYLPGHSVSQVARKYDHWQKTPSNVYRVKTSCTSKDVV
jgi:transposase